MKLSDEQLERLEELPADCRVMCADGDAIVLEHSSGRLVRLQADGRLNAPVSRSCLVLREIDVWCPKVTA